MSGGTNGLLGKLGLLKAKLARRDQIKSRPLGTRGGQGTASDIGG